MHSASFGVDLQSLRSTNLIAISAIVLRCNTHVMLRCNMTVMSRCNMTLRELVAKAGAISAARPPVLCCAIELSEDQGRGPAGRGPAGGPLTLGSGVSPSNSPLIDQLGVPLRGPPRGALRAPRLLGGPPLGIFRRFGAPSSLAPRDPQKVEKNRLQTPQKLQVSVGVGGLRPLT